MNVVRWEEKAVKVSKTSHRHTHTYTMSNSSTTVLILSRLDAVRDEVMGTLNQLQAQVRGLTEKLDKGERYEPLSSEHKRKIRGAVREYLLQHGFPDMSKRVDERLRVETFANANVGLRGSRRTDALKVASITVKSTFMHGIPMTLPNSE